MACNTLFPGVSAEIVLQLDKSGTPTSGEVHLVYDDEGTIDCYETPSAGAVTDIDELTETYDTDGDGCPDYDELGPSQGSGGRRDPFNPYDYFNPSGDGINRVDDILLVVGKFFDDDTDTSPGLPPYAPGYNPDTDRTLIGPNEWNLGPPNGLQRVDDILAAVKQFFHDCS